MTVIRKSDLIRNVAAKWRLQYPSGGYKSDKDLIYCRLFTERPTTEDEVEAIIGNSSWTSNVCDECGKECNVTVQIGEEPDYESATVVMCEPCLVLALDAIRSDAN
jgi:hypothetical protein